MKKRGLDPVIIAMSAILLGIVVWYATSQYWQQRLYYFAEIPQLETEPFVAKYGSRRFSRNLEEVFIRDFFQDKRDGVFLDVGANHYRDESNTYFLEAELGWSGVAVEALEEFRPDYVTHRPKTKYVAAFASDVDKSTTPFFVPQTARKVVASSNYELTVREGTPGVKTEVPTTTLNTVLAQAGITALDFMSMDIELAEPLALRGFDIEKYRPALVCIEAHAEVRQPIIDYFHAHGYRIVGKYLRADARNLYFTNAAIADDPALRPRHAH